MASTLTRWDPFGELQSMRSAMDRLFESGFGRMPMPFRPASDELGPGNLALDVAETADAFTVTASVPGIDPKDIDITIEDNVLTIRGETKQEEKVEESNFLRRELRWGSVERSLRIPPTVDAERAEATFAHGLLKLSLPKRVEARPKAIKVTPKAADPVAEKVIEEQLSTAL
ncbi:MAG: Hsp20/alpha crystallin family protein [Dehalococcoidia bacterium]